MLLLKVEWYLIREWLYGSVKQVCGYRRLMCLKCVCIELVGLYCASCRVDCSRTVLCIVLDL